MMSLKSHYVSFNSFEIFTMQLIQNYLQAVLWRSVTKKNMQSLWVGVEIKHIFNEEQYDSLIIFFYNYQLKTFHVSFAHGSLHSYIELNKMEPKFNWMQLTSIVVYT